ncbi:MAG: hypothetical protein MRZ79_09495 [Bacteroidia bacterium]|nr:hypothetical protein [Bacteroidia bacterium]
MRYWIFLISILMAVLALSCFSIREVEPPLTTDSDWVSPTDYELLLDNLEQSIIMGNTQNYLRCFNQDSLAFTPVSRLLNDNESIWLNWSSLDERTYLDNLFQDLSVSSGNSVILSELDLQNVTSDSLRYVGNYLLRINHNTEDLTTLFKGQMQLVIKLNSFNEWEIHRWIDIETAVDSSWSSLKLAYIQ